MASSWRTARASSASPRSSTSSPAPCRDIPTASAFSSPTTAAPICSSSPREMHKVLHGDRATARRIGIDRRGRPEGEIVDVLERANRTIVGRLLRGARHRVRRRREPAHQPGPAGAAGRARRREVRRRRRRRDRRAAVAAARGHRARRRGARAATPIPAWRSRSRCASTICRTSSRPPRASRPTSCRRKCATADRKGRIDLTALPLVTIDGETAKDFDDAVYCERNGKGFRLIVAIADVSHYVRDGDALDRDARERGTSVYFPAPRDPDAARGAVERALLAQAGRRPPVHGLRDGHRPREGAIAKLQVLSGRDALARAPHLHAGLELAVATRRSAPREAKPLLPQLDRSLRALPRAQGGARGARRDRLRHGRDAARVRRAGQDRAHRPGRAQRRAQADRGMHARGERLHRGVPRSGTSIRRSTACTRARRRRSSRRCATSSRAARCRCPAATSPTAADYAKLLLRIKDRPDYALLQTVLLRSLQQARYRPDNVGHFGLSYEAYAHFTSPIRRYPDLLVHRAIKAVLASTRVQAGRHLVGRARRALLADRAARRRRDARRRELAQVLLHAGQGRRDVRRHDQRRHELRHLRHARRPQHRRPRARHRARPRLLPLRRRTARADRRAHAAACSSSPAACASRSRASTSRSTKIDFTLADVADERPSYAEPLARDRRNAKARSATVALACAVAP